MCKWNEDRINDNIEKIQKRLLTAEDKDEILVLSKVLENQYSKMDIILNNIRNNEDENYVESPSPFLGYIYDDSNIRFLNNKLYHSHVIESVAYFLRNFNSEYYEYFCEMNNHGLISLHKSEDEACIEKHFIDPINKDCFIYVSSNNIGEEKYALIRQFGYVLQAMKNKKDYNETDIFYKDTFPLFLEMSMISFYDITAKEGLVKKLIEVNQEYYDFLNRKNSNIIPISEKVRIFNEDEDYYQKQIVSNDLAIYLFMNNEEGHYFNKIEEFIQMNHHSKSFRNRDLWNVARGNIEKVEDPKKEKVLSTIKGNKFFEKR